MFGRYLIALAACVVAALALAVYWPGLAGGFFFDDGPSILLAEGVRLETLSLTSLHQAWISGGAGPTGRPVAQLSFALNHYFAGFNPFFFKSTNLAIHLISGWLVFSLVRRLLNTTTAHAKPLLLLLASGAATTLWLLHPIQLLPVLHVVQRMTSLSALFLLAALLVHIRGREQRGSAAVAWLLPAWCVLWPLSVLSKETGVLFPLLALAWELIVRRHTQGQLDRFARAFTAVVGLCLLCGLIYMLSPRAQWLWAGYEMRPFSLAERLLTEGRVLWFYLGLIVIPRLEALGLYHDDIAFSTNCLTPWTTLPALAGLLGLVWLVWRLRIRAPLVAFGIAWFLIGHGLESTVLPLELAHEHRNYLPLFGILVAAASLLTVALQSKGARKTLGVTLTGVALVYLSFITALRNHQFGDDVRRTQIEAQHHRTSARAQHEAGHTLAGLPEAASPNSPTYAFAERHYELANQLDVNSKMSLLGIIHLSCQAGRTPDKAWLSELTRRLQTTPFAPGDRTVLYSLKEMAVAGSICLSRPEIDNIFTAALANPGVGPGVAAMLHSWHADYFWLHEKDMPAARKALATSLALNPSNPSNRLKWAQLLYLDGERDAARVLLVALQSQNLSTEERKTLDELLTSYARSDR